MKMEHLLIQHFPHVTKFYCIYTLNEKETNELFFHSPGDSLFLYIGEKIPQLKSRVFKSSGEGQATNQSGGKKKGKGGRC
jgi:hypothetical protein